MTIPTLVFVNTTSVTLLYEPPANSGNNSEIIYRVKWRQDREPDWYSKTEIGCLSQTVTSLWIGTPYDFTVAAKYEGGQWGQESGILRVQTGNDYMCVFELIVRDLKPQT